MRATKKICAATNLIAVKTGRRDSPRNVEKEGENVEKDDENNVNC